MPLMLKQPIGCPNLQCSFYKKKEFLVKDGLYFRKNDGRKVQRYRCTQCKKKCSHSSFEFEYRQKKRRVNTPILKLICSSVSQRRAAKILGINKKTVERKLVYLAKKCSFLNQKDLLKIKSSIIQIDDLITKENSKLKPLTISGMVDEKSRFILGLEVGVIPSFGHLAKVARKKYGKRENQHRETLKRLFYKSKNSLTSNVLIKSDEHQLYPTVIKKYLPHCEHKSYKGGRGCVTGQGELKRQYYDPLFAINHTFAMLRANINRLVRRTWCTTKRIDRLQDHLEIIDIFTIAN